MVDWSRRAILCVLAFSSQKLKTYYQISPDFSFLVSRSEIHPGNPGTLHNQVAKMAALYIF
jgi:hypothetical protein